MTDVQFPETAIDEADKRESEEEEYQTPPTTPPALASNKTTTNDLQVSENLYFRRPDPIALPRPSVARKRPLEEPNKPLVPRKISRGRQDNGSLTSYNAHHLSPLKSSAEARALQNIPLRVAEDTKQVPHFLRSYNSFSSTTSLSMKTGSSLAWPSAISSQTTASTAKTTPNTSFRTESPGTSFECTDTDLRTSFHDEDSKYAFSEATIKFEPNTPRTKSLSLALQGLNTTSETEPSPAFEHMNVDVDKTNPSLTSATLAGDNKAERIGHITVDEYLEEYLVSSHLLRESAMS